MDKIFLFLPLWYLFWIVAALAYDAWKMRPWKGRLRAFTRLLLRNAVIFAVLTVACAITLMLFKERSVSADGWNKIRNDFLPRCCVMFVLPLIASWERSRERVS